jgi:hypothetical protein
MPPDPARTEDTRAWLDKAAGDLRAGPHSLTADPPLTFDVSSLIDRAAPLPEYAWRFRYPGDANDPSNDEAVAALAVARAVFQAVIDRLPNDVRPAGRG